MEWKLKNIIQETDHKFLNFFTLEYEVTQNGITRPYSYFMASRHDKEHLLAKTKQYGRPDGVIMALYEKGRDGISVLLTSQYRPAIGTYLTSFSAGLLDEGDDVISAAKREAEEEVGLLIDNVEVLAPASPTSSGLSDECCAIVLGEIVGRVSARLEENEDITSTMVPLKDIPGILKDPCRVVPLNVRLALLYLLSRFGGQRLVLYHSDDQK